MQFHFLARLLVGIGALALALACSTSPLGRSQLKLYPDSEMAEMGFAAFAQIQEETPATTDRRKTATIQCIVDALAAAVPAAYSPPEWDTVVFESEQLNAFALPGGKIGVYTGLMKAAVNPDQLSAVIGHEMAHVIAGHGNERVSTAYASQTGIQLASVLAGAASPESQQLIGLLGGNAAQYGVILPFGRAQESEADLLGLDWMAMAGFDPRESVKLWENMANLGGEQPPEFTSTHPSHGTRIEQLQKRMDSALELMQKARAAGKRPNCAPA